MTRRLTDGHDAKSLPPSSPSVAFGEQITCRTGRFRGTKVPSELLPVTVLYGKNTTKEVGAAFQYLEDPKVTNFLPKDSFLW